MPTAVDTNLFTIVVILLSNGKDKPPRRNMVLCFRSKFTKKLNIKLLSKGLALKSVVFKLDHKIVKFFLKDMQSKKEVTGIFDTVFANETLSTVRIR